MVHDIINRRGHYIFVHLLGSYKAGATPLLETLCCRGFTTIFGYKAFEVGNLLFFLRRFLHGRDNSEAGLVRMFTVGKL